MKKTNKLQRMADFAVGKGFYIFLIVCVATIGISGYYLLRAMNQPTQPTQTVTGDASVVLPDSEKNGPDPQGSINPDTAISSVKPEKPAQPPTAVKPPVPTPAKEDAAKDDTQAEKPAPKPASLVFTWPLKGEVLRDFSVETLSHDPTLDDWRTHGGLDLAATLGTQVVSIAAGEVTEIYDDGLMGTTVVISHSDELSSIYCNLSAETTVAVGDTVDTGSVIGSVGETAIAESGLSSHLHLELIRAGTAVDPTEVLPKG